MQIGQTSLDVVRVIVRELEATGIAKAPYDRVMFTFHPSYASQHLLAIGNWDETRRQSVRTILQQARQNFHRHPRPWWVGG